MMPNFTRFRTLNNRLKYQPIYTTCIKLLLTTDLSNYKSDLIYLNKQFNEMLFIRKLNRSLNKQTNSELFTLIIRNFQQDNSKTRDFHKFFKPKQNN